jgi:hypothetical protein
VPIIPEFAGEQSRFTPLIVLFKAIYPNGD